MIRLLASTIVLAAFFGCSSVSYKMANDDTFEQNHSGFMLYDPVADKVLDKFQAEKYFTPASNTKIFSLFAGLKVLGDSVPGFRYHESGDSLIIWGTGDPSFLNPNLAQGDQWDFLTKGDKQLYFSSANFVESHFGPGWAWDDYNDAYSVEKTPLPIYGNFIHLEKSAESENFAASPSFFNTFLTPEFTENNMPAFHIFWIVFISFHVKSLDLSRPFVDHDRGAK